jgi:hypothetical protein
MNHEIRQLHQSLGSTVEALSERLGKTTDRSEAEAILREIEEVNFRVMMAGRLLFERSTENLNKQIENLINTNTEIKKDIKKLEKTQDIIKSVSKFLTKADNILDRIKTLV